MSTEKVYDDSSIQSLKGADRVRKRPGVMLGSNDIKGAFHTFVEILGNSLDEARGGHGKKIEIILHSDKSITVSDSGRGMPLGWNEREGRFNWDLIFNELYAGGKMEDDNYKFSVGLNGLGATAVQYSSEYLTVTSKRQDSISTISFKKGYAVSELDVQENPTGETGTTIRWKCDDEVFIDTNFTFSMFVKYCEVQAHLNKIDLVLLDEETGETVTFEGLGLESLLTERLNGSIVEISTLTLKDRGIENGKQYVAECEVALAITEEVKPEELYFHNTATMDSGPHLYSSQQAVSDFFKGAVGDSRLTNADYRNYISLVVSTYSNNTDYAAQTKNSITNPFISRLVYKTVTDLLEVAYAKQTPAIMGVIENIKIAIFARIKAKEVEQQQRALRKLKSVKAKAEKLVDCSNKKAPNTELFIVEGDSALGACKRARDSRFQAILPIRGKILNCLKADISRILKNEIVKDVLSTMGTGADIEGVDIFDMSNLAYSKIIICTDADVDGYQIRVLLYTLFYRLTPQLLKEGKVFIAETPLFEIETSKGSIFAYTLAEKDAVIDKLSKEGTRIIKVHRSKGLGENDPEMLSLTTMHPETRKLIPLEINCEDSLVRDISNMLFGKDVNKERKAYIYSVLGMDIPDMLETVGSVDLDGREDRSGENLEDVG